MSRSRTTVRPVGLSRTAQLADRRSTVILLTITWGLVLGLWACLTPMYGAPDEAAHVDSIIRIQGEHTWPAPGKAHYLAGVRATADKELTLPGIDRSTFDELLKDYPGNSPKVNQMTQHPPLYYILAGLFAKVIHFESLRWDLAVTAFRLFDIILMLPLPLLVWATVRRLTASPKLAVLGAMSLFAVPQLQQITSSVSNDGLMVLMGGVTTWLAVRYLTGAQRWPDVIALGVSLGILLLTKGTGLPAVPFVAVALLAATPVVSGWGGRILRAFVSLAIAGVVGGWWWLRNLLLYHDFQPSGLAGVRPTVKWPEGKGPNPGTFLSAFWDSVPSSFWGKFGRLNYPMLNVVSDFLTVVAIVVIVAYAYRRSVLRPQAIALTVLPVITLLLLLANTWRVFNRTALIYGIQGRYLYVAIVALVALSALAWSQAVVQHRTKKLAVYSVAIGAPLLTFYGYSLEYRGVFENFYLAIDKAGLYTWAYSSAVGPLTIGIMVALVCVAGLWSIIRTIRSSLPIGPGDITNGPVTGAPGRTAPVEGKG